MGEVEGLAIALTTALAACGADPRSDIDAAAVATTYADLVAAAYQASIDSATTMQVAIEAFLSDPTDENLAAAKAAWVAARDDYTPTEAFRFYDGPIDNPDDGPEGQINAWPLDEAYIDYVNDAPEAGIINDLVRISVDHCRSAGRGERSRRRNQHLHRVARNRVLVVGTGP